LKQRGNKILSLLLASQMLITGIFAGGIAQAADTLIAGTPYTAGGYDVTAPHIIINQVYGGGTKTATDTYASHGFIELYNPTDNDVNLSGWSLHYAYAPKTGISDPWVQLNLTGTIQAHSSYLIIGKATGAISPIIDLTTTYDQKLVDAGGNDVFINNKGLKAVLVNNTNTLTGVANPFLTPMANGYVDMLGTAGNDDGNLIDGYETEFPVGSGGNSKKIGLRRVDFKDTDNNKIDFQPVDYSATSLNGKEPRYSGDGEWGNELGITTMSLPDAYVHSAYSVTVAVYAGKLPYTFAATGLPEGLNINDSSGTITGTPTTEGSASVNITVTDSANTPAIANTILTLNVQKAQIADQLNLEKISQYTVGESNADGGVAEIVKYNKDNSKMYVVNGAGTPPSVDIVALTNSATLTKEKSILVKELSEVDGFVYGDLTSVDINTATKRVAIAVQEANHMKSGKILVLDYEGNLLKTYETGVQPDMVLFTSDGKYLLTADEAEPRNGTDDPEGSVTIIDTTTDVSTKVKFDNQAVIDDSVHIRGSSDPSTGFITGSGTKADAIFDLEPEYIALNDDQSKAYIALQENNAIAVVDIASKNVDSVKGLGYKDYNDPNNSLDLVKDSIINMENVPFLGMYMPDGIASYNVNGTQYLFTANEGDATEWSSDSDDPTRMNATKIGDIKGGLNSSSAAATFLNGKTAYDKVEVVSDMGIDGIYLYGGRSFSIWNASTMQQVFDSGNDFETITSQRLPKYFNTSHSKVALDDRSTKKGPEPEYVTLGQVGNKAFAFVGLERIGGIMTYDVTDPLQPVFANYINTRDFTKGLDTDTGPEGLEFIPATSSPTGLPLLLVANEVSGTISVLQLNVTKVTLDKSALELQTNGASAQLTATVTPDGGGAATVSWTSSNEDIATVDVNGLVTSGAVKGTAVITALSADGYGVAEATVTVSNSWSLTVMHTNDTHAHLADVARRATLTNQVRNEVANSLLLDAGDVFSGDLYFTKWAGQADLEFMNYLGYDAMTFGNHEFDSGTKILADFISKAKFPLLTSNVDFSKDVNISPLLKAPKTIDASAAKTLDDAGVYPYIILDVNGHKVGVFGLTTEDTFETSSPGKNVKFNDATASAKATVAAIKVQGVNVIITLSHLGYNRDKQLAKAVEGIDLIVGGHTHTKLSTPEIVTDAHDAPTVIVQANEWSKFLGRVNLQFDAQGVVIADQLTGSLIPVTSTVAEDETVKAMLAPYNADLEELKKQVIGNTTVVLNGIRNDVRSKETNLGNFIADGMLYKAKLLKNADIALMNGGGIRGPIDLGQITMGELRTVMPFGNTLYLLDVTGQELIAGLENGISGAKLTDLPGKFPQVAGMRFKWDPSQVAGSKVYDVEIKTDSGYTPLNLKSTYRMATNSFVALGGDGYTSFAKAIENGAYHEDLGYPDYEIFMEYLTSLGGTIAPVVEGRITERAKPTEPNGDSIPPTNPTQTSPNTVQIPTPSVKPPVVEIGILSGDVLQVTQGTNAAGDIVNQVTVKAADLQVALTKALSAAGTDKNVELTINMQNLNGATEVTLPAVALNSGKANQVTIRIETGDASYSLPLHVLNLSTIDSLSNVSVRISISPVSNATLEALQSKAKSFGAQLASNTALEFEVFLVTGTQEKAVSDFGSTYVSRTIYMPAATNVTNATAVMVDPITSDLIFVPNVITTSNGKPAIVIKRPGNSVYTMIQYKKNFTDLNGHWAKNDIEAMASKLIVKGVNDNHFAPSAAITRAEFTALLVRSMGLTTSNGLSSFKDIETDAWYAGTVETATQFGLVNGNGPGTFAANATITRAEMAVMIARAMVIVDAANVSNNTTSLNKFSDKASIPQWATTQAALLVDKGIMQGNEKGAFTPSNKATRAEAAIIIQRTLRNLNFSN
jgi:2',3'-cyclic-nucleotide 2'-phosphodiesterase/3'-nucleotidase/5'-nucleotidase